MSKHWVWRFIIDHGNNKSWSLTWKTLDKWLNEHQKHQMFVSNGPKLVTASTVKVSKSFTRCQRTARKRSRRPFTSGAKDHSWIERGVTISPIYDLLLSHDGITWTTYMTAGPTPSADEYQEMWLESLDTKTLSLSRDTIKIFRTSRLCPCLSLIALTSYCFSHWYFWDINVCVINFFKCTHVSEKIRMLWQETNYCHLDYDQWQHFFHWGKCYILAPQTKTRTDILSPISG